MDREIVKEVDQPVGSALVPNEEPEMGAERYVEPVAEPGGQFAAGMDESILVAPPELPFEIVETIFDMVTDPQVMLGWYETCPDFRQYIKNKRCWFLIPKVAPCLVKYLTAESFKELRKTNVFWKEQLDLAYQTHPEQATLPAARIKTLFKRSEQIGDFLEEMVSHPGNPFIGRNLRILYIRDDTDSDDDEDDGDPGDEEDDDPFFLHSYDAGDFHPMVVQLLTRFGEHLHTLSLRFYIDERFKYEEALSAILQKASYLQVLKLEEGYHMGLHEYPFVPNPNIWPRLVHLKTFEVNTNINVLIGLLLLQLCDPQTIQCLTLGLERNTIQMDQIAIAALENFSKLQELTIHGSSNNAWDKLEAVMRTGSPLSKLVITFFIGEADFLRIGAALAHFKESLEHFSFSCANLHWITFVGDDYLNPDVVPLPKLKQLTFIGADEALKLLLFQIQAPLNKVYVRLFNRGLSWHQFFMTFARFADTLVELYIVCTCNPPVRMDEEAYTQLRVALPQLRRLKITNVQGSLEPVFQLKSLSLFLVRCKGLEFSTQAFELVERVLKASPSIWEKMPKLQEFTVKGEVQRVGTIKSVTHVRGIKE